MKDEFLKAEVRCGFTVSEKRKKIWKVQLELLGELDRVCRKYRLRYYAVNGTLLGAVRHKGFIPWDDDLDVMMPREDYEKLREVSEREFTLPVYFQDGLEQDDYYRMYGRLRNADTTAFPWIDADRRLINGIFIDIFPIDGLGSRKKSRLKQQFMLKLLDDLAVVYTYKNAPTPAVKKIPARLLMKLYCGLFSFRRFRELIREWKEHYELFGAREVFIFTHSRMLVFQKKQLLRVRWLPFEDRRIPVPEGYDEILKQQYGAYMELPPEEKRGQHHSIFFDPDRPYSYYYGKLDKESFSAGVNTF